MARQSSRTAKPQGGRKGQDTPAKEASTERREQNRSGWRSSFFPERAKQLDDWLELAPDGNLVVFSGKVELGTGVRTALAQIVAEELDVPLDRIHMVMGDTAATPNEGYTAGSMTVKHGGAALREAAAEARQVLLEMAGDRLDADPGELAVQDGVVIVRGRPERRISYWELMGGKRFNREVTGKAPQKQPADYRIVGRPMPRLDIPAKLTGQPSFVQDFRLPGMLHGRVLRPPSPGARLVSVDPASVKDISGLVQVVHLNNFVAVVAEREEQARRAAAQLQVGWEEEPVLPPMDRLYDYMREQKTKDDVVHAEGNVERAFKRAERRLHAVYYQPYQNHASMGPSCAVAEYGPDSVRVWSSTQGVYPLRKALADLLELPEEKVQVIHIEGPGVYGHNGSDDAAADAVILSRSVGRPVRVQWSREEEFAWEPKAPAMLMEVSGGLDSKGDIVAWQYDVWSPPHSTRPQSGGDLLAGQAITGKMPPGRGWFGGGDRNALTNYRLSDQRVSIHWLARSPLRASSMRSLGGTANTFANESFMDELAAAAHRDPLEFRLAHLDDPRAREVLQAAADAAGWKPRAERPERSDGPAGGQGIAFARYENSEAYIAAVAKVQVDRASGHLQVQRIVVAFDCGLIINPDGLRNQVEGNVIQSLSRALKEEVRFDERRILSLDWESYPILKFTEVPEVEVVLLDRPQEPAVGAGEPSSITTAPAVANAIFDATGARLRRAPFTPARIRQAMSESGGT